MTKEELELCIDRVIKKAIHLEKEAVIGAYKADSENDEALLDKYLTQSSVSLILIEPLLEYMKEIGMEAVAEALQKKIHLNYETGVFVLKD